MQRHQDCHDVTVVDPPERVYRDVFHHQVVDVIHPIEVINRHHLVPCFRHIFKCEVRDEFCDCDHKDHHDDHDKSRNSHGHKSSKSYKSGWSHKKPYISKAKSSKPVSRVKAKTGLKPKRK